MPSANDAAGRHGAAAGRGAERRVDPRTDVDLPVDLVPPVGGGPPLSARIHNLSGGGALCTADASLRLNSLITCRIRLPVGGDWPEKVRTDAIVLRVDRKPGGPGRDDVYCIALYFVDMDADDREALRRFVFTEIDGGAGKEAAG